MNIESVEKQLDNARDFYLKEIEKAAKEYGNIYKLSEKLGLNNTSVLMAKKRGEEKITCLFGLRKIVQKIEALKNA